MDAKVFRSKGTPWQKIYVCVREIFESYMIMEREGAQMIVGEKEIIGELR